MHLRRGRSYKSLSDSPSRRSVSADGALERSPAASSNTARIDESPVNSASHDNSELPSIRVQRPPVTGIGAADLSPSVSVSIQHPPGNGIGAADTTQIQRPPQGTGAADRRPRESMDGVANDSAISVNNISLNKEANNKSSSDEKQTQRSSSTSGRRSRISHIDTDGFSHIIKRNKIHQQNLAPYTPRKEISRASNCFSALASADSASKSPKPRKVNTEWASMMLDFIDGMSDDEAKRKIIARARKMDQNATNSISTTQLTLDPIISVTQATGSYTNSGDLIWFINGGIHSPLNPGHPSTILATGQSSDSGCGEIMARRDFSPSVDNKIRF